MSYAEFTNPGGGYKEFAYPEGGYPPQADKDGPKVYGKEGVFLELSPYKDLTKTPAGGPGGVGPYNVNHFVGYFKLDGPGKAKVTVADFFANFTQIFNPGNSATATKTKYTFKNHQTVAFVFDAPGPDIHADWTTLQRAAGTNSFFATTLMKLWMYAKEVAAINELKEWAKIAAEIARVPLPEFNETEWLWINQRHFLSGRRSWSIEYSPDSGLYYVETVAFERSSHILYMVLEDFMGSRQAIVDIWTTLIANFANFYGLTLEDRNMAGYTRHEDSKIYYITDHKKTVAEAQKLPWFSTVLKRHPGLLTP